MVSDWISLVNSIDEDSPIWPGKVSEVEALIAETMMAARIFDKRIGRPDACRIYAFSHGASAREVGPIGTSSDVCYGFTKLKMQANLNKGSKRSFAPQLRPLWSVRLQSQATAAEEYDRKSG